MARRANDLSRRAAGHWLGLGVLAIGLAASPACGGTASQPAPSKLSDEPGLVDPPVRKPRTGPFTSPDEVEPGPRQPQVPPKQIDAALADAAAQLAAGTPARAVPLLHRCANKQPASARCDGELAIVLADLGTQRAHMRYFMAQAAKIDDPLADDTLYRRLGAAARRRGQHQARADAAAILIARGSATADDYRERAQALSSDGSRLPEAVDALRIGYEKTPERHDLLLERAVLVAQTGDAAAAAALMKTYLARVPADAPDRATVQDRIAVLQRQSGTDEAPSKTPPAPAQAPPAPPG